MNSPKPMSKWMNQANSASRLRELFGQRGFLIPSRAMTNGSQQWIVFQRGERQVGVDAVSGIWLRESESNQWRCVATKHTTSGACMAIDFLTDV